MSEDIVIEPELSAMPITAGDLCAVLKGIDEECIAKSQELIKTGQVADACSALALSHVGTILMHGRFRFEKELIKRLASASLSKFEQDARDCESMAIFSATGKAPETIDMDEIGTIEAALRITLSNPEPFKLRPAMESLLARIDARTSEIIP